MRKIIVLEHISLDGVIQAPGGPKQGPELHVWGSGNLLQTLIKPEGRRDRAVRKQTLSSAQREWVDHQSEHIDQISNSRQ